MTGVLISLNFRVWLKPYPDGKTKARSSPFQDDKDKKSGSRFDRYPYSHSMVPGGFEVMS